MNKSLVSFLVIIVLVLCYSDVEAQCAMCKQVAEDATNEGGRAAGMGLNNGIKCLLVMPYILFGIFISVFFRKKLFKK
jgi:hypothetical protein